MKNRRWTWFLFLILFVALLSVLATRYNVAWIKLPDHSRIEQIWGTIGFAVVALGFVIFFVRLRQEMRLNQLQSEFLAAVTHELKTPIATMDLSVSLLKRDDLRPEERDRLWRSHETELKRLKSEVETLLEAARWDSRAAELKRKPLHLESWLRAQMGRWKEILGEGAELIREGAELDCHTLSDVKILNLICDNLVDNARKFALDRPTLIVSTRREGPFFVLRFQDSGIGFDPSEEKKIFRRFVRGRHFSKKAIPGTGLGLFLARSAADRLRLRIAAYSEGAGKGATFSLEGRIHRGPVS